MKIYDDFQNAPQWKRVLLRPFFVVQHGIRITEIKKTVTATKANKYKLFLHMSFFAVMIWH